MIPPYELHLTPDAKKDIRRLDSQIARRIMKKLLELAENVEKVEHYALKGELKGLFRLRIGDYRAIYLLKHEERLMVVESIGHRSDIYDE